MVEYKDALKALKRSGTAHATGPAYAAMCAGMVSYFARLDGPAGKGFATQALYAYFGGLADDAAVRAEMNRLMSHPAAVSEIVSAERATV